MCDLFILCAGDEELYCIPHVIKGHRLHACTLRRGLHFAQEKARFASRVTPERDVFWIVQWIGAILLRAARAKDSNNGDTYSRCQVHRAAVITNEEGTLFELRSQFAKTGFACYVLDCASRYIESFKHLLIECHVVCSSDQQNSRT